MSATPKAGVLSPSARAWGRTLLVLAAGLAVYVGVALAVTALTSDAILGAAVSDLVAAVLAIAYRWRSTGTPLAGEPRPRARTVGFWMTAAVALAVCWTAGQAAASWVYATVGSAGFDAVSSDQEAASLPLLLLTAVVLAPLGEESLMRGIAYPALRRHWPPLASAFVTSAVFSILHGNLVQIALTIPLGILLAFVYEGAQRLWPVVTMHVLFNIAGFIVPKRLVEGIATPAMIGVLAAAAAVLLFALAPSRYKRVESEHQVQ